jgi:hypothetical protein
MKPPALALAAALILAPALSAQKLDLKLDHLIPLAKEHAVIDMDGEQIRAAMAMAPEKAKKLKGQAEGIQALQVRTFEFENEGAYKESDLEDIRRQLQAPGWSKIVSVRETKESVDVYLMAKEGQPGGIAVLAAEPKELTVVHILGALNVRDLQALVNSTIAYDLSDLMGKKQ